MSHMWSHPPWAPNIYQTDPYKIIGFHVQAEVSPVDFPSQLTFISMNLYLYLSVFHDISQSYKYGKHSREICYVLS